MSRILFIAFMFSNFVQAMEKNEIQSWPSWPNISRQLSALPITLEGKPFLFKLSDQSKDFFLLGSDHWMHPNLLYPVIRKHIKDADVLVPETFYHRVSPYSSYLWGSWASKETLKNLNLIGLNDAKWFKDLNSDIQKHINQYIFPYLKQTYGIRSMDEIHPGFFLDRIVVTLNTPLSTRMTLGMDLQFIKMAEEAGKKIIPLESPEDLREAMGTLEQDIESLRKISQLGAKRFPSFIGFIEEEYKKFMNVFRKFIDNEEPQLNFSASKEKDRIIRYLSGSFQEERASDQLYKDSIDEECGKTNREINAIRNQKWIEKIERILQENPNKKIVIMVGLSHLPDSDGLLKAFQDKGMTIQQFDAKGELSQPLEDGDFI